MHSGTIVGGFGRLLVRLAVPVSRKWKATWAVSCSRVSPCSLFLYLPSLFSAFGVFRGANLRFIKRKIGFIRMSCSVLRWQAYLLDKKNKKELERNGEIVFHSFHRIEIRSERNKNKIK